LQVTIWQKQNDGGYFFNVHRCNGLLVAVPKLVGMAEKNKKSRSLLQESGLKW
jgi:hypothetical protein